ncbi:hypothetical protein KIPB_001613, partial [Kipferlia bialata]|eukprot:g1613.t1
MAHKGFVLQEFVAHRDDVTAVCMTPGGQMFATGSLDGCVHVFSVGNCDPLLSIEALTPVSSLVFSEDEQSLAVGLQGGSVRIFSILPGRSREGRQYTYRESVRLHGHLTAVTALSFSPSSKYIVTGSADTTVKLWHARPSREREQGEIMVVDEEILRITTHQSELTTLSFTPNEMWLISGDKKGRVLIWNIARNVVVKEIIHRGPIYAAEVHPRERLLAVSSGDRTVRFWDIEAFAPAGRTPARNNPASVVIFTPPYGTPVVAVDKAGLDIWEISPSIERDDHLSLGWGVAPSAARIRTGSASGSKNTQLVCVCVQGSHAAVWVANLKTMKPFCLAPDSDVSVPQTPDSDSVLAASIVPQEELKRLESRTVQGETAAYIPPQDIRHITHTPDSVVHPSGTSTHTPRRSSRGRSADRGRSLAERQNEEVAQQKREREVEREREAKEKRQREAKEKARLARERERERERERPQEKDRLGGYGDVPDAISATSFLHTKAETPTIASDHALVQEISGQTPKMLRVLSGRLTVLRGVKTEWLRAEFNRAIDTLVEKDDPAITADVLKGVNFRGAGMSLEHMTRMVSLCTDLLQSRFEEHVVVGIESGVSLTKCFSPVILPMLQGPKGAEGSPFGLGN